MQNFNINLDDYKKSTFIAKGGFGEVYLIRSKENEEVVYAAKISINSISEDSHESRDLTREINIISKIDHPSILKFIGFSPINFEKNPYPVIVTEYLPNKSLDQLIDLSLEGLAPKEWDDTLKLITLYGIASGMSFLHEHDILHRDLKPANILLDTHLHPKICDFGLSKDEKGATQSTIAFKGTLLYSAPEVIEDCNYSKAGDVYSFGIIAYQIIMNDIPFDGLSSSYKLQNKIVKGDRPEFKSFIEKSYRELIESCWDQDISNRPTFQEILTELKTNPDFITDTVDENAFLDYVDFIDNQKTTYNPGKPINIFESPKKVIEEGNDTNEEEEDTNNDFEKNKHKKVPRDFPPKIYNKLNKKDQKLVDRAIKENDETSQYYLGVDLLLGKFSFPKKPKIAVIYLEKCVEKGNMEAVKFYCRKLIDGSLGIPQNLERAREILEKYVNDDDPDLMIYFLYGLLLTKEEKYEEAKQYLKKTKNCKYGEPMHVLGQIYYDELDYKNAKKCFLMSKNKGFNRKWPKIPETDEEIYQKVIEYIENENEDEIDYDKAISLLSSLASNNHFPSLKKLGKIYYHGYEDQVDIDYEKSYEYFQKAADFDDLYSVKKVALMSLKGIGTPEDHEKSAYYYKKAADLGDTRSILKYSRFLIDGDGVEVNLDEALSYLEKIENVEEEEEYIQAIKELKKEIKTKKEDEIGQNMTPFQMNSYGYSLEKGIKGELKDEKKARVLYQKAAEAGLSQGMLNYARVLQNGIGGPIDSVNAAIYYKKAADEGNQNGIFAYGLMLEHGNGINANKELAVQYYKKAADMGQEKAMLNYARCVQNGIGVKADLNEALKYYKKAGATKQIRIVEKLIRERDIAPNIQRFNFINMFISSDDFMLNSSDDDMIDSSDDD